MGVSFERAYIPGNSIVMDFSDVISAYEYCVGLRSFRYNFATAVGLFQSVVGMILVLATDKIAKKSGQAGLIMPKSQEDMEKALLKFKEMKLGGAKTIPATQSIMSPYIGAYDYCDYPLSEKDNALYSDITVEALTWEPVHKELQRLNKGYNEGLLSPEWALDKEAKTAQADFMNGIEGKTYTLDNGLPKLVTGYTGTEDLNYNSNKDIYCLVTEGKDYGSEDKNVAVQKTTYAPAGFENLITDSYNNYKKY